MCDATATHKVGEEIPWDEPCMVCEGTERMHVSDGPPDVDTALTTWIHSCTNVFYHLNGPTSQRHNLTAYVCCGCFTKILGPATGCQ